MQGHFETPVQEAYFIVIITLYIFMGIMFQLRWGNITFGPSGDNAWQAVYHQLHYYTYNDNNVWFIESFMHSYLYCLPWQQVPDAEWLSEMIQKKSCLFGNCVSVSNRRNVVCALNVGLVCGTCPGELYKLFIVRNDQGVDHIHTELLFPFPLTLNSSQFWCLGNSNPQIKWKREPVCVWETREPLALIKCIPNAEQCSVSSKHPSLLIPS